MSKQAKELKKLINKFRCQMFRTGLASARSWDDPSEERDNRYFYLSDNASELKEQIFTLIDNNGWVSVEDKGMPEKDGRYTIILNQGATFDGLGYIRNGVLEYGLRRAGITHWMLLEEPADPKDPK